MVEIKQIEGILNTDDSNEVIAPTHHKMANNVVFRNGRGEGVKGTTLISNSDLPNTGTNRRFGDFYDDVRQRIYWFNYNSGGKNGFYYYDIATKTVVPIIICFTDSTTDILGFDLDRPIASINIVYGDDDIVYYVDSLKRPTYVNINKAVANYYGQIKREFIDVAKPPAVMPPQVTYEDDTTVTINNLRNSLFQFCYTKNFVNNEKPVWSSASIVPLPNQVLGAANTSNISNNARIAVYLETGDIDVKSIDVAVRQYTDAGTSDWLKVVTLDKTLLGISNNTVYRYLFYNDAIYTSIKSDESNPTTQVLELQDYVPRETNCQELLNGNTIIYGGILEGFDKVPTTNTTIAVDRTRIPLKTYNGLLFFAYQTGDAQITLYLTGVGTNDGSGNPTTLSNSRADYKVKVTNSLLADKSFSYVNTTASTLTSDILDGLEAAAIAQGFTTVSQGTNTLVLSFASNVVLQSAYYVRSADASNYPAQATFSFAPDSRYSFIVEYFDDKGRTNGATHIPAWDINTKAFNYADTNAFYSIPQITLSIYHRPPLTATYYHIGRSDTLTYAKRFHWVSNNAVSDNTGISSLNNTRYAYIDITNITLYNSILNTTGGSVGYDFAKGDRIRFMGKFNSSNVMSTFTTAFDYEIIGVVINPNINGTIMNGRFVQIIYPTSDIGAVLKFDADINFVNYIILLYSYKKHEQVDELTYFEFSKQFKIGNAGLATAYHIGQEQTQSTDLVTPAQILFTDGDFVYRYRDVPKGGVYYPNALSDSFQASFSSPQSYVVLPITTPDAPITAPFGTIKDQHFAWGGAGSSDYPTTFDTDPLFENTSTATVKLHIKWNYTFDTDFSESPNFFAKIVNNPTTSAFIALVDLTKPLFTAESAGAVPGVMDTYVEVYAGCKIWIMLLKPVGGSDIWLTYKDVLLEIVNTVTIPIIESTYSDYYQIKANSNSRATVVDDTAHESYSPSLLRWSLPYQQGTNINETNRFLPLNFDEIDKAKGDIQGMKVRERTLRIFQNRGVGRHGVYAKFLQQSNGSKVLTTTNDIITANNIDYLQGEHGCGTQYTSIVSSVDYDYFIDTVTGDLIRVADNGMLSMSDLYKGQYYIKSLLTPYNKDWIRSDGGIARIFGYFDYLESQYVCVLEGGTNGSDTISDYTFAFKERRVGNPSFTSFFDFHPEGIVCAGEVTYSWLAGQLYIHDNTTFYCKFYGVQYYPSITLVFNDKVMIKKVFNAIAYQSNQIWVSDTNGDINTSMINPQTGFQQQSQLKSVDYEIQENIRYAAFLKDKNSGLVPSVALLEGDDLNGTWIEVKLTYKGSSSAWIFGMYVNSQLSNRNF